MSVEYAPKGLIGLLTPQANTTVEPEMAIMTPPGYAFINARLTSDKATIEARLVDYFATLPNQLSQFANAPIGTALVATSGMSYLAGVDAEARILEEVSRSAGIPVFTSAIASVDMLNALGARRIALVSPYPETLNVASREPIGRRTASPLLPRRARSRIPDRSIRSTACSARRRWPLSMHCRAPISTPC